ncbi:Bacterial alpha-L-rhamnosidase [Penicillium italicum]|uniref:alpha-L-rhamnosidase n=1 Tax=Penicillium italicum TaxID=40296 RepID=A0A0A2K9S7_PENIT|nr:Bacterial alpha-L-rhamnosidase [Penicillium italicum]
MTVQPTTVRFEHRHSGLGIGLPNPRLSWRFTGQEQSWIQQAYELSIRKTGLQEECYKVDSGDSVLVPWPSSPLKSSEQAEVRVRVWPENQSAPTAWSEPSLVECGLLHANDWDCQLIELSEPQDIDKPKRPVWFRKRFAIRPTQRVRKARLYITSLGVYHAEINGQSVGDDQLAPGWTNYQFRQPYQTYDVTESLHAGDNVIAAEVGEGWYAGRFGLFGGQRNIYGSSVGLICQLSIAYEDGEVQRVGSSHEWDATFGPRLTSELYDGEVYDAQQHMNVLQDGGWLPVKSSNLGSIAPKLFSPDSPPVRCTQEILFKEIVSRSPGKVILDFGQNLVGRLRVNVTGPPGHTVTFQHVEVLENGKCATRPLRHAAAKDTLILSGETIQWEPRFTFHGFRYVEVTNWPANDGLPGPDDVIARVLHTDMERTGWFECSDPLLNQLHENIVWGMRGNFLSVPTDCPQRDERLGWTGDISVFAPTGAYLYGVTGMLQDWVRNLALEQLEGNGNVPPLISPNLFGPQGKNPTALWGDCVVKLPWDLYQVTGDIQILEDQWESMRRWIDHGIDLDERGLWRKGKTWQLGDWLDPIAPPDEPGNGRTDPFLVADACLINSLDLITRVSDLTGKMTDQCRYAEWASRARREFAQEYISATGRVVSDSQTALALAIEYNLLPTAEQTRCAAERLEEIIRSKARFKIATGFAGTPIIGHALTKVNRSQLFYRMLLNRKCPSWLYTVLMGATTIWERWDSMLPDGSVNPGEMTSFNHYALGAVGDWMHQVVGGLSMVEPGWKKIRIRPIPGGGLSRAKVNYLSPYGMIEVEWHIEENTNGGDESFRLRVSIPPNSTAMIFFPQECHATITVGSGTYEYQAPYSSPEWPPLPIYPPFAPHDDDTP